MTGHTNSRPYKATPRARRKIKELGLNINLADLQGSAPTGHIIEKDILEYVQNNQIQTDRSSFANLKRKSTPLAEKIAKIENIALEEVIGTGPRGKIISSDVLNFLASRKVDLHPTQHGAQVIPLAGMRRVIAKRMVENFQEIPHVTLTTEIEMTNLVDYRERLNRSIGGSNQVKISYNDLFIKACALALKEMPQFNVSWQGDNIILHPDINIGLAVAVENGLVVPVIKDADKKSILEIARESKTLIEKARSGKLALSDTENGRFTISNLGMYDIDAFTPIINKPEPMILGVGRIKDTFIIKNGNIRIGKTAVFSLVFDHRLIDGAPAATFLKKIKSILEDPISKLA